MQKRYHRSICLILYQERLYMASNQTEKAQISYVNVSSRDSDTVWKLKAWRLCWFSQTFPVLKYSDDIWPNIELTICYFLVLDPSKNKWAKVSHGNLIITEISVYRQKDHRSDNFYESKAEYCHKFRRLLITTNFVYKQKLLTMNFKVFLPFLTL